MPRGPKKKIITEPPIINHTCDSCQDVNAMISAETRAPLLLSIDVGVYQMGIAGMICCNKCKRHRFFIFPQGVNICPSGSTWDNNQQVVENLCREITSGKLYDAFMKYPLDYIAVEHQFLGIKDKDTHTKRILIEIQSALWTISNLLVFINSAVYKKNPVILTVDPHRKLDVFEKHHDSDVMTIKEAKKHWNEEQYKESKKYYERKKLSIKHGKSLCPVYLHPEDSDRFVNLIDRTAMATIHNSTDPFLQGLSVQLKELYSKTVDTRQMPTDESLEKRAKSPLMSEQSSSINLLD
jgi:hypothetical protein